MFSAINDHHGRRRGIDKRGDDNNKDEKMKEEVERGRGHGVGDHCQWLSKKM